jgi:xanthine/CO dehydrogenase XdhC/CoxF family maturation factor
MQRLISLNESAIGPLRRRRRSGSRDAGAAKPLLTSNEFHNTGVPPRPELAMDHGRLTDATAVLNDEFNSRSQWRDARECCSELESW